MGRKSNTTRADARRFHFIYRTTCKVTGRWYIGMHSTNNLNDGYVGSGKLLWYSINKYGLDAHVCEILEFCIDRKSLSQREAELVSEETLKHEMCLNLQTGGGTSKEVSAETRAKLSAHMLKPGRAAFWKGKRLSDEHKAAISKGVTGMVMPEEGKRKIAAAHKGKVHTAEHRKNNSKAQSKTYLVEYEDGRQEIISNLRVFCIEHQISNSSLRQHSAYDEFFKGVKLRKFDGSVWTNNVKCRVRKEQVANNEHVNTALL